MHNAMRRVLARKDEIRHELACPQSTLEEMREGYIAKLQWWNDGGPRVAVSRMRMGSEQVSVSVYGQEAQSSSVIVYTHGGGWIVGDSASHDRLLRMIALTCRCVVYSINYSLAPEAKYPTQVREVIGVVEELSEQYSQLILMGDSCGATLMLQVIQTLRGRDIASLISGTTLFYGSYGLEDSASLRRFGNLDRWMSRTELQKYEQAILPTDQVRSVLNILDVDLTGYPPAYVVSAECDPLCDDSRALVNRLSSFAVSVRYREVAGVAHAFMQYSRMLAEVDEVITDVAQWIRTIAPHS
ncbi:alpha/beta hydrolase fold domain-containing protein [Arcanobacterium phocisimile]|uniref:Alpha/beta hydrolase fold domain-containing protein n=1 Tax=Arcanobacterium phocisimile TaxID=1302235 RepID=A0ABX7IEF7_9ACTO|nr:alpha/beta hydrolase fold domain-containing protein [Arcanobacterium phocisimile]QRV01526.1 alpha/beta hydrolase fold domain-containing protein [Arcanobacterium phocisimile]